MTFVGAGFDFKSERDTFTAYVPGAPHTAFVLHFISPDAARAMASALMHHADHMELEGIGLGEAGHHDILTEGYDR